MKPEDLFQVEKELDGRDWNDTDTFGFTLAREGTAPMPDDPTASVDRSNTTAAIGSDQQLVFTAAGDVYLPHL